jgi:hypothetical protein
MLAGHGKWRDYYDRFKITEDATCTCNGRDQTIDHLIWDYQLLKKERNALRRRIIAKGGRWPLNKSELVQKFTIDFYNFCNVIDFQNVYKKRKGKKRRKKLK